ncbi:hypothetical protein [Methanococcoides sp. NM1]|uniref:hypothetical protein n=1 Tax=Methanococcoides sp. NM1 TaxID=1201013 RepID=UPI0014385A37|nr:hypothetical protein [Methanococcoides sp. NM1]
MYSLLKNERAADSLPLRFTIASLLILLIMALFFTAISDLKENTDENIAKMEIDKLVSNSEQISVRGEGSIIHLKIDIPDKVKVYMGELPNEDNLWPSNSKNYYIHIKERQTIYESMSAFSNENMTGAYTITPGHHELKLETERDPITGMLFVKISEK